MSDSDIKNSENVLIQENITENTETPKVVDLESFEFNEVKKWDDFDKRTFKRNKQKSSGSECLYYKLFRYSW